MPQPALGREGEIEEEGCDHGASDEEGFEALGADVGNECNGLVGRHGGVVGVALDFPYDEHGKEHACCCGVGQQIGFRGELERVGEVELTEPHGCAEEREDPEDGVLERCGSHCERVPLRRLSLGGVGLRKRRVEVLYSIHQARLHSG